MSAREGTIDRRRLIASAGAVTVVGVAPRDLEAAVPAPATIAPMPTNRGISFDSGWLFHRGEGQGYEAVDLPDVAWRKVDLPHDWSVEDVPGGQSPRQVGPFDRDSIGKTATGYTVGGEGWYRKHFRVDKYASDTRIELMFGGSYLETDVWLNGRPVGASIAGYAPFWIDLTPVLDRNGDNVLAVRVRNIGRNSRWYSGSGLYRSVSMDVLPAGASLERWGVGASTRRLSSGRAEVAVSTRVISPEEGLQLVTRLREPTGRIVAQASSSCAAQVDQTLSVRSPRLWSTDAPNLYQLETELLRDGRPVDVLIQDFGIRIVHFDPQRGMSVNGTAVRLRGGCVHHDNGLLGACAFPDADARRIALLKARGYNAIRSSHNPASASLRRACDRLGMWIIEEAFDAWMQAKEPQDFSTRFAGHWREVLEPMVLQARNSPSVLMWSIGNEIPGRSTDEGVKCQWTLANAVRSIDPTRPITAGVNGVLGAPMTADAGTARPGRAGKVDNASTIFLDVPGYNYRLDDIAPEATTHPERVVYASETFAHDMFDYKALSDRQPSFLGEFLWTAMDYIGEAGVGATAQTRKGVAPFYLAAWPWVNAWCGDLDLIGRQKAPSLARDVVWGVSPLEIAVKRPLPDDKVEFVALWGWPDELASWSWSGMEGKPLSVRVYCAGDRIELRLNGVKIAEKALTAADRMQASLDVPYAPGTLEAVAFRDGRAIARRRLETAGPAAAVRLTVERRPERAGDGTLSFVQLDVVDSAGRRVPEDERAVRLAIDGSAELLAFGSACPFAVGSLKSLTAQTWRGGALAILRHGKGRSATITASADGLTGASAIVRRAV